jgi:hypothetical protein
MFRISSFYSRSSDLGARFYLVLFKTGLTLELLVPTLSPLVVADDPVEEKNLLCPHVLTILAGM